MRSLLARRNVFLLLSALSILAVTLLASGLDGVTFADPRPFSFGEFENFGFPVADLVNDLSNVPLWKQILFWVGIYLIVLAAASLLTPELRKKLLRLTAQLAILSIVFLYLMQNTDAFSATEMETVETQGTLAEPPVLDFEPPVFIPPRIPPALTYLISVALVLAGIGFAWFISRYFSFRRPLPVKDLPLEGIAAAARSSLRDLLAGRDWEDSILLCYQRMTEVVARRRGFQREPYITPSEFASRLEQAGLPSHAVRRLTGLFESVRYGARGSAPREGAEAVDCLREVLHYCGEAAS